MKKAMKVFKIPDDDGNITYRVQTPDGVWHDTDELGNFLPEGSEAPRKEPGEKEIKDTASPKRPCLCQCRCTLLRGGI